MRKYKQIATPNPMAGTRVIRAGANGLLSPGSSNHRGKVAPQDLETDPTV